ncbi:MAG: orotate phosphoribosyltransferase [Verrucomicrobiaceae bacterium TMED76]|nr:MAG: orotate phosphoribosyltransferase [Verrucomicrobiaceae bacterium TMED76]
MPEFPHTDPITNLYKILKEKSFFTGDFTLASGKKSNYYIDCRLTTLDPEGACLIGAAIRKTVNDKCKEMGISIDSIGGLTLGADPIALSASMASYQAEDDKTLKPFVVRKAPKEHGKGKQIEGGFKEGDSVVALDDVITTGGSTLKAIEAIENEGGKVEFVLVLVDRQEGGKEIIEESGYKVFSLFTRDELFKSE